MSLVGGVSAHNLENGLDLEDLLLQHLQGILHHFVGVLVGSLHLELEGVVEGVGLAVACKLDILVFQRIDPQQIADSVILPAQCDR